MNKVKLKLFFFLFFFIDPLNRPENVPRLFDLIKVKDEKILPAFYYAVRDTLVANDLEQATRIAYGKTRYRVVTLDGQLIDQSGIFYFSHTVHVDYTCFNSCM